MILFEESINTGIKCYFNGDGQITVSSALGPGNGAGDGDDAFGCLQIMPTAAGNGIGCGDWTSYGYIDSGDGFGDGDTGSAPIANGDISY